MKCSEQFETGCQVALALMKNISSGTENSQIMETNFLADSEATTNLSVFPPIPQPLLAPGLMAFVLPQLHLPTAAPWGC